MVYDSFTHITVDGCEILHHQKGWNLTTKWDKIGMFTASQRVQDFFNAQ